MNPNDPFLPQIIATPGDTDLRLVYADWLEEQGDPRGEFIRLETKMGSLIPYCDEYAHLKVRRNQLRTAIDSEWLRGMGYVPRHRPLFTRLPRRRVERWRLVEEFIDAWHSPLTERHGYSEEELTAAEARLGFRLPAALREWYSLAGKRKDVWSQQDRLVRPLELDLEPNDDALIIRYENQACERWGIRRQDLGRDDPPIFQFEEPARNSPTTTAFAAFVLLYEAKFARGVLWTGTAFSKEEVQTEVRERLSRCKLPETYYSRRMSPVTFYEGIDLVLETHYGEWVYVAARGVEPLRQLSESFRGKLDRR
jgi:uncharacterized protein (TIGR02996 family)